MGLFDKKFCDFCGGKIGLLGNRKLSDGNMCKECAAKISPYLVGRKEYSVDEMKEHLAYREENKERLSAFNATRTLGVATRVHIDEDHGLFVITASQKYKDGNPDVMELTQITGCNLDIDEKKTEEKRKNAEGKEESYVPARYKFEYDFNITVNVNHRWFDQIRFKVNSKNIEGRTSIDYKDTDRQANDIIVALQGVYQDTREAAKPKTAVTCPSCGASTLPDMNGCCEYCGAPVGA